MSDQQASSTRQSALPFAVSAQHLDAQRHRRWRTAAAVLVLSLVLGLGLTGLLGGGSARHVQARASGLTGELVYDRVVRSGNWYETTLDVQAERAVTDLTVAVDEALWSRMSIDTMAPDAESAEALDGRYTYHFGPVKAGERFRLKLDGQIQPGLMREQAGAVRVLDGERELMALPVELTVLP